jgi:Asp-tRNA(Asn)/Glu-tRNA(Gln) amidotransferase A subunit family amidase
MDLHQLSLCEITRAIREGELTSEQYTRACLAQIARHEPHILAWQWLSEDTALEKARAGDAKSKSRQVPGALRGIPVGIKDIIATRGIPTEMGSPIFSGFVPQESAVIVARLEAAGAFVLGKTVTAELAFLTPGKTRNPWNPAHTPGGSSSGSAAAVAAGFVPAAVGTQTNGSVIRPAAFCGVVGFKPSQGLIATTGIHPFSPTLDQVGVFTRSVDDAALFASCLVDTAARQRFDISLPTTGPRLAAVRSPVWHLAEEAQKELFLANIAVLQESGAIVTEVTLDPFFTRAHAVLRTIMCVEAARQLDRLQQQHRDKISATLNNFIDEGRGISAEAYTEALQLRDRIQDSLKMLLQGYDAIITPPAAGEAPATLEHTGDPSFCTIWTLCGVPAITIPAGQRPRGLPLGLQVVGPHLGDDKLLRVAKWCVEQIGFAQPNFGSKT